MSSPDAKQLFAELQSSFPAADRERLNRILDRCRVDLEDPLRAMGTGSQITLKRGTALKLALEGADMAAVTAASSLSEERVLQVRDNVRRYGFEALYPRFDEKLPLTKPLNEKGLWKVIKEFLATRPSAAGVSDDTEKWRPSTATDYLVHIGTVEDASASQIAKIIGDHKDRKLGISIGDVEIKTEYPFEFSEPSHRGQRRLLPFSAWLPFGEVLCGIFLWGLLTGRMAESGKATGSVSNIFFVALLLFSCVLLLGLAVKQTLEWWLLQKVLASTKVTAQTPLTAGQLWKRWFRRDVMGFAENGKVPARSMRGIVVAWIRSSVPFMKKQAPQQQAATPRRVNPLGTPKLTLLNARTLPDAPWDIDSMSESRNALGTTPIRTLYLWVFDAQDAQRAVYQEQGWLQLGPVHMLLNATALPLLTLWRKGKDLLLRDPQSVDQWMAGFDDKAGPQQPSGLFGDTLMKSGTYVGYPLHAPLCSDGSWEHALHQLAGRCELAVVNLSGYDPSHPGLEYEIRHLLAGGPPRKFVFMYDHVTDADAVIESVLSVWNEMEAPATLPELIFVRALYVEADGVIDPYQAQFQARSQKKAAIKQRYEQASKKFVPVAARLVSYMKANGHLRGDESGMLQAGD
jgi:hypothetical protein